VLYLLTVLVFEANIRSVFVLESVYSSITIVVVISVNLFNPIKREIHRTELAKKEYLPIHLN
jgi:hypothetical protein